MKVVTASEMREIDRTTIKEFGISGLVLMERAGLAVAGRVAGLFPSKRVLVLCGGGNNGGDGLVAARELFNRGAKAKVIMLAGKELLGPDCKAQLKSALKMGVPVEFRKTLRSIDLHGTVVVDAVLGTGLSRKVTGPLAALFAFVNKSGAPVVSVDVPSGISSDTGEILGKAVEADATVTFGLPKIGHLLHPGAACTGRLFVEDIGFPSRLLASEKITTTLLTQSFIRGLILPRPACSHKGDYGHVLVVAGSRGRTGAAMLASRACLAAGAGLVTVGVPESLMDVFQAGVMEQMTLPLPDDGRGMLSEKAAGPILDFIRHKTDVVAIGPGIGVSNGTQTIVSELICKASVPLVLDADALNSIRGRTGLLKQSKSPLVLTPHAGEMARLMGKAVRDIEKDRLNASKTFAKETGTWLVLKGAPTVIAGPEGQAFINSTGNPGMATAGSGDVLTGIISALLGQGLSPSDAAALGVYLHGMAGDMVAGQSGMQSLTASRIIGALPEAFLHFSA
jgi:NAD(P)H-hydrate epimerase